MKPNYGRNVIFHFRVRDGQNRLVHNGGVTVVMVPEEIHVDGFELESDSVLFRVGASACSLKETYDKKRGVKIATGRAVTGFGKDRWVMDKDGNEVLHKSVLPETVTLNCTLVDGKQYEKPEYFARLREVALMYAYHVVGHTNMFRAAYTNGFHVV